MRVKANEAISLFNSSGEWEAKVKEIIKGVVEFTVTKKIETKRKFKRSLASFFSN